MKLIHRFVNLLCGLLAIVLVGILAAWIGSHRAAAFVSAHHRSPVFGSIGCDIFSSNGQVELRSVYFRQTGSAPASASTLLSNSEAVPKLQVPAMFPPPPGPPPPVRRPVPPLPGQGGMPPPLPDIPQSSMNNTPNAGPAFRTSAYEVTTYPAPPGVWWFPASNFGFTLNDRSTATAYEWGLWFTVPYWFIALPIAIPPAIKLRKIIRRYRTHAEGTCRKCGYDLRASTDRCPECGQVIPAVAKSIPA